MVHRAADRAAVGRVGRGAAHHPRRGQSRGDGTGRLTTRAATRADLEFLTDLAENGTLCPLIERRYPLAETADAFVHLADGHAQGETVILG
ncbi:zinc-binding dehydrogenase [Nocardia sp. NBC_00403]|uniref:zinc-binding dehydrogenase n=1 Tax=Nocardia sp. NBC_00403 TaxID=2975990 RepID=UPI003FA5CC1B